MATTSATTSNDILPSVATLSGVNSSFPSATISTAASALPEKSGGHHDISIGLVSGLGTAAGILLILCGVLLGRLLLMRKQSRMSYSQSPSSARRELGVLGKDDIEGDPNPSPLQLVAELIPSTTMTLGDYSRDFGLIRDDVLQVSMSLATGILIKNPTIARSTIYEELWKGIFAKFDYSFADEVDKHLRELQTTLRQSDHGKIWKALTVKSLPSNPERYASAVSQSIANHFLGCQSSIFNGLVIRSMNLARQLNANGSDCRVEYAEASSADARGAGQAKTGVLQLVTYGGGHRQVLV